MTKAEIVSKIADNTGVDKTVVLAIVEEFMTQVKDSLIERENVYLRGFGSFIVKERKQKVARNISKQICNSAHCSDFHTDVQLMAGDKRERTDC